MTGLGKGSTSADDTLLAVLLLLLLPVSVGLVEGTAVTVFVTAACDSMISGGRGRVAGLMVMCIWVRRSFWTHIQVFAVSI